ncbi:seryl-tRNA synthetase, partial [Haematococcus lacustris]
MLFRKEPSTLRHGVFGQGQAPRVSPSIRAQASATQTADIKPVQQLYKASIDFRAIKDNLEAVEHNTRIRNSKADPRRVVQLYDQFVQLKLETDSLRAERNTNSSQMKGKLEKEQRDKLIHRGQQLKEQLAELEAKLVQ